MTHDETSTGVHVRRLRRRARPSFRGGTGIRRNVVDLSVADAAAVARQLDTRAIRTVAFASLSATGSFGSHEGRSDPFVPKLLAHAVRELVRAHVPADRLLPRKRSNR